jgi:ribosomal protein L22
MSTSEPDKPPRRRRRKRKSDSADAPDAAAGNAAQDETVADDEATRPAASSEATAESPSDDEIEPTPADEEAEDEAADVVLEADDESEGESELPDSDDEEDEAPVEEPEAETPRRGRRPRRRQAAEAGPPPAPAPTRRRARRDPSLPPPVVRAQAKYVRSSPRKARLVCDHIRGKTVDEARAILAYTPRAVARDWSKLLESAVANAENNHDLVGEDLYVKAVHADEGPTIKRFRPRALGRATRIRKRTSHLTILLTPKE